MSSASTALAQSAAEIAAFLERGQAERPLYEAACGIARPDAVPLQIVLLGLDRPSKAAVLRWLIGPQHNAITVRLVESLGFMAIRLQERGYSLVTEGQHPREFAQAEEFASALEESLARAGLGGEDLNAVKLGLAASPQLWNIEIGVLPSTAAILERPGLLAALRIKPVLLALAIPESHAWRDAELEALRIVAARCIALWPIVVGDTGAVPARTAIALSAAGLPVLPQSALLAAGAFLPPFVVGNAPNPLRAALAELARARNAATVVDMLRERVDAEAAQLRARTQREARLERHSESAAPGERARAALESLKAGIIEDFAQLIASIREQHRRALSRTGALSRSLRELAQTVHGGDLERRPGHKMVRLSLKSEVLAELRARFGKAMRHLVEEDCILVRDSLELARARIEEGLAQADSQVRSLPLPAPDSRELWETLQEAVEVDVSYRGEVHNRGFLQRLGQGRQVVFSGLMILSLVGSFVGFNFRRAASVGLVLLAVFIAVVIYTYRSWKREDEEAVAREIEKVNDSLGMELDRLASDVVRELESRLQSILEATRRDLLARLDTAARQTMASTAEEAETERREARSKIKVLEARERELQALVQKMARVCQMADALASGAAGGLHAAIKPAEPMRAAS